MCFTWNTETIPLCDVDGATTCYPNDYFNQLAGYIRKESPSFVAFAFQEDAKPGSYFHSHYAPEKMKDIGYKLLSRPRMMGIGKTTVKGLYEGRLVVRGLRLSLYAHNAVHSDDIEANIGYYSNNYQYSKGGIAVYLTIKKKWTLAFINCHLEFDAKSLIKYREAQDYMLRRNALAPSNSNFNSIIDELVHKHRPTHVFMMGDFNYRINHNDSARELAQLFIEHEKDSDFLYNMYLKHDELRDQMIRGNIYPFEEGIDDKGPIFIPTAKMIKRKHIPVQSWEELKEDENEDISRSGFVNEEPPKQEESSGWYSYLTAPAKLLGYISSTTSESISSRDIKDIDRHKYGQQNNKSPIHKMNIHNPNKPYRRHNPSPINVIERNNRMWNTGKWDQRTPSWTDRILYGTANPEGGEIICTYYNRFDVGNTMLLSDHAGVLGTFVITTSPTSFVSFKEEQAPINLM